MHTKPKEEVLPDDILVLKEQTIHGWVDKQSKHKGYFGNQWKRIFMVCENFKLCYYVSEDRTKQKAFIDFLEIPCKMVVSPDNTFAI